MAKKAMIAMSGGVDSSVSAKLMCDKGYECIGVTMRLYDNDMIGKKCSKTCCSEDDVADARSVAYSLGMQYYVFNFSDDFDRQVISRFVSAYENGFTPNPCIDCNRYMKFEKLFNRAQTLGYDYIVTGHYARIEKDENTGRYLLKKAVDDTKDQSYVLYSLTQQQLAHTVFPLGSYRKTEIRKIAEENGFINAKKHDSQDICFVPDGDYAEFIKRYTGKDYPPGDYKDSSGRVLGKHKGIINYTVGQRRGLGIALGHHVFVLKKDIASNSVTLGEENELYFKKVIVKDLNFISVEKLEKSMRVKVKLRYRHTEQPAVIESMQDGQVLVTFDEPQRAPTAGQAAVFYDGDTVVGGGVIVKGEN